MGTAPVCHISVDEVITQPAGRTLAYVPPVNDLKSALRAIEALRQNLMILTGQLAAQRPSVTIMSQPGSSSGSQTAGARPSNSQPSRGQNQEQGRWIQASRVTKKVKITNPDDESQFVEVLRTERLTMRDTVTGELWVFNNGSGE